LNLRFNKLPAVAGAASNVRLAVTFVCLVAFSLQAYIAQTHFHYFDAGSSAPVAAAGDNGKNAPFDPDHSPLKEDPAKCPFFQAVAQGAAALLPHVPVLLLSSVCGFAGLPVETQAFIAATVAQGWQIRGPPRA
jgi:hypothetical protein